MPHQHQEPVAVIREAIARQDEHLRRTRSCEDTGGGHSWDRFSPRPGAVVDRCWRCRVTRTDLDFRRANTPLGP